MNKKSVLFQFTQFGLDNLSVLRDNNIQLSDTQIMEYALSLAVIVQNAWNNSYHLMTEGSFQLDNDHQALSVTESIQEVKGV